MVEEIARGLYRLQIPLPGSPLKSLNSYVIKGSGRNLVIDTGYNMRVCQEAMQTGLKELGIDLRETDFFITHLHADHTGLIPCLVTDTSKIFFNRPEVDHLRGKSALGKASQYADMMGFPADELTAAVKDHPAVKHGGGWQPAVELLMDGDLIAAGEYEFCCVETPGHSLGHICLYEPKQKLLVAGDHILSDITPTIQLWSDSYNPLKNYLSSLDKIAMLDIDLVLPGHRRLFNNCQERVQELKEHHNQRANEILQILRDGPKNAYQVAGRMTWEFKCPSWEQFPVSQRWFATGEAIAHLAYLKESDEVRQEVHNSKVLFSLT